MTLAGASLACLPLFAFAASVAFFRTGGGPWRAAFGQATLTFAAASLAFSELLGSVGALHAGGLGLAWSLAGLGFTALAWRRGRRPGGTLAGAGTGAGAPGRPPGPGPTALDRLLLLILVGFGLVLFAIAFSAPANNGDVLGYHLPRIEHWLQNASLAAYPTHDLRQAFHPPQAELLALQFRAPLGSHLLMPAIGVFALLGSALAASLAVEHLSGSRRAQLLAAAWVVSLPMGLLQATGGKNDWVAALFLILALERHLAWRRAGSRGWAWSCLALALAVHTKGTGLILGFPLGLWFAWDWVRVLGARAWRPGVAMALLLVACSGPQWARNLESVRHPLNAPEHQAAFGLPRPTPAALFSNLLRNATVHAGTPFEAWNDGVVSTVEGVHALFGLDPADPETTHSPGGFHLPPTRLKATTDGNPLHVLVLGLASLLFLVGGRARRAGLGAYALALAAGVLAFCAALQWQAGISRLHLPWFVLLGPWVALVLHPREGGGRRLDWIFLALLAGALPYLLANSNRPLFGRDSIFARSRTDLLFVIDRSLREPLFGAARLIEEHGLERVGLHPSSGSSQPEALIWSALAGGEPQELRAWGVSNSTAELARKAPFAGWEPQVVLYLIDRGSQRHRGMQQRRPPGRLHIDGQVWTRGWNLDRVALYVPTEAPPAPLRSSKEHGNKRDGDSGR